MANSVITTSVQTSTVDLWGKALEAIPIGHTLDLTKTDRPTTLQEILGFVLVAEEQCMKKRWKWKNRKGEQIILRDVFSKMAVWIDKFKSVGDVIVQYDPGHAALPWAAVRFILQAAINDIQTNATILEGLEMVMNLIAKYETIEILYLRSLSSVKVAIEENILKLYVAILNYLIRAHHYFSQKTIARIANSIFQLESSTTEFLVHVRIASSKVDQYLPIVSEELQQKSRDNIAKLGATLNNINLSDLEATLKSYDTPILRMCSQLSAIEDHLRAEERVKVFEWLTTDEYQSHHKSKYKSLLPGSGEWLLQKPDFTEWQGASSSSILWLHGIPGSGKSMLLAHVIEHLISLGSEIENPAPIAFFYCARNANEPERADPAHLMRTILEQLCSLDEDTPIREPVVNAYKQRKKASRGKKPIPLTLDESVLLMLEILQSNPAIVIIDGLDECDPALRRDLLDALTTIINESSSVVKVLVSSRDDQDLVHHLSHMPNIYIRAAENTGDIRKFVETRLHDAIMRRKILRGNVSDDLKGEIIQTLIHKAKGMFRLVSMHIETLCDPNRIKTRSNVLSLLATLPQDLKHSYDMVLAHIRESQEPNPTIADRIIKWLLCARAPLRAKTFLLAVSSDGKVGEQCTKFEALDICSNLIAFDEETKQFRFVHLSVQEHLLQLEEYSVEECNALVSKQCLCWLMAPFWIGLPQTSQLQLHSNTLLIVAKPQRKLPERSAQNQVLYTTKKSVQDFTFHVDRHWAAYVKSTGSAKRRDSFGHLLSDFMGPHDTKQDSANSVNHFSVWVKRENYSREPFPITIPFWDRLEGHISPLSVASAFDFVEIVKAYLADLQLFESEVCSNLASIVPSCAQVAAACDNYGVLLELFIMTNLLEPDGNIPKKTLVYRSRRGKGTFVNDYHTGLLSICCVYWWKTIDTIVFEDYSGNSNKILATILEGLGSKIMMSGFLRHLITHGDYPPDWINFFLPHLMQQNKDLYIETNMLFGSYHRYPVSLYIKSKDWYIDQFLVYIGGDIVISQYIIELSIIKKDLEFYVILQLLGKSFVTIEPAVVGVLIRYGNLEMLHALKSRRELDIWNRRTAPDPQEDMEKFLMGHGLNENVLVRLLKGKAMKQFTLTSGGVSSLLAHSEGMGTLRFVLEAQPDITPAAINMILATCDKEIVKAVLAYQETIITDEIVRFVARNVKHGDAIMRLLLEKENGEDVGQRVGNTLPPSPSTLAVREEFGRIIVSDDRGLTQI